MSGDCRYCDEAQWFNEKMRYTVFKNGLRSERSIEAACEWVVAKGLHRPVCEDYDVDCQTRGHVYSTSGYGRSRVVDGNSGEIGVATGVHGLVGKMNSNKAKVQSPDTVISLMLVMERLTGAVVGVGYGGLDWCAREQAGHGLAGKDIEREGRRACVPVGEDEADIEFEEQGVAEVPVEASCNEAVDEVRADHTDATYDSEMSLPKVKNGTVAECLVGTKVLRAEVRTVVVPVAHSAESRTVSCQEVEVGAVVEEQVRTITMPGGQEQFGAVVETFPGQDAAACSAAMEAVAHAANARLRGDQDGGHGAGVARGERVRRAKDEGSVDVPAELGEKSNGEKSKGEKSTE
ncbi:hypothetical protein PHYSODRAFT_343189 [Phytophthora sojae]|uniref:Uncharacterized protein n=1 Tax=Phytophthora sojae (strain P6497) TaxID=1094619 RepID=G5AIX2_PHYSP|nr:hypothetical protein PHYSODRAFT_340644 [Phytophthora sojae]XP_009540023.1 hypothetical protein PHYSODRAFT_343189 [Phytophthora sojae]EGZ04527.1 hypothetical protein PHYSODRAFT_343189 [Phytophthora sojae]EGZ07569.1 hypothetical protein PHYSODRAFT_340644 [Phytophthora sojae]|eukprot:XP_009537135.1 hypothetical protein PHYSODRAFT_340644 [Phytophthora sojae]